MSNKENSEKKICLEDIKGYYVAIKNCLVASDLLPWEEAYEIPLSYLL